MKNRFLKYHFSRVYELIEKSSEIRPIYMKCLRTTSIHGEVDSESVLMNILLRNFMHNNLLDQGMNSATNNLDIWWIIAINSIRIAMFSLVKIL